MVEVSRAQSETEQQIRQNRKIKKQTQIKYIFGKLRIKNLRWKIAQKSFNQSYLFTDEKTEIQRSEKSHKSSDEPK